jgi:hypothetical protein
MVMQQHNSGYFAPGGAQFLTQDEESSLVIDTSGIFGPGWFLIDVQAHFSDPELVEGGQYLAFLRPDRQITNREEAGGAVAARLPLPPFLLGSCCRERCRDLQRNLRGAVAARPAILRW